MSRKGSGCSTPSDEHLDRPVLLDHVDVVRYARGEGDVDRRVEGPDLVEGHGALAVADRRTPPGREARGARHEQRSKHEGRGCGSPRSRLRLQPVELPVQRHDEELPVESRAEGDEVGDGRDVERPGGRWPRSSRGSR